MNLKEYLDKSCITVPQFSEFIGTQPANIYNLLKGADIKCSLAAKIHEGTNGKVTAKDLYYDFIKKDQV